MRVVTHPVLQFLAGGLLLLLAVAWGTGALAQQAANREAVSDARATTELLAGSVAEPALPRGLVAGRAGAIDRFDRAVLQRLLVDDVVRVKIWDETGRIVYSDRTALIGQRFPLEGEQRLVLAGGPTASSFSALERAENRFEGSAVGLVEVYTRITSPEGVPLLFEVYFDARQVAAEREEVFAAFRPITLGGLALFLVLTSPLLWLLTSRLQAAGRDRERLLQAAVDASDAERRRIARDLHDGVVQDLAGTAMRLSAAARRTGAAGAIPAQRDHEGVAATPAPPSVTLPAVLPVTASVTLPVRRPVPQQEPVSAATVSAATVSAELEQMSESLRRGLRSLRSLLVEIYPPDLHAHGLAGALDDLLAPAAGAGVRTRLLVGCLDRVPEERVAVAWRVAQEAVRNALRHGEPRHLWVRVHTEGDRLRLVVSDDGTGFDPDRLPGGHHFGLRGLRDLVRETGGLLDVRSAPGRGTTVVLEVG